MQTKAASGSATKLKSPVILALLPDAAEKVFKCDFVHSGFKFCYKILYYVNETAVADTCKVSTHNYNSIQSPSETVVQSQRQSHIGQWS